ncbi:hypothetical protein EVAR_79666_1 [Eumeta japonica]|uniref:Uncharacterized protein n=1 Tax=Eumeta variegata TaxID=151549 RepID=A0A4C1WCF8_EUMVA|nr:hypothetical protein EVAR_79666_1 [Eumeta japonica]
MDVTEAREIYKDRIPRGNLCFLPTFLGNRHGFSEFGTGLLPSAIPLSPPDLSTVTMFHNRAAPPRIIGVVNEDAAESRPGRRKKNKLSVHQRRGRADAGRPNATWASRALLPDCGCGFIRRSFSFFFRLIIMTCLRRKDTTGHPLPLARRPLCALSSDTIQDIQDNHPCHLYASH